MYRRYSTEFDGKHNHKEPPVSEHCGNAEHRSDEHRMPPPPPKREVPPAGPPCGNDGHTARPPLLKFIPQSIYNPETGKVFGFMSAEDLLLAALILVLLDNKCEDEDNSMLIYALLYILLSDYIDLPI